MLVMWLVISPPHPLLAIRYLQKTYGLTDWTDAMDFLSQIALKSGRLLKGGEPDVNIAGRRVLSDWQRGKIPWFAPPPDSSEYLAKAAAGPTDGAPRIAQLFHNITVNAELGFDETDRRGADEKFTDAGATDWDAVYKDKIDSDDDADAEAMDLEFPDDDDSAAPLTMTKGVAKAKGDKKDPQKQKRKAAASMADAVAASSAPAAAAVRAPKRKAPLGAEADAAPAEASLPLEAAPPSKRSKLAHGAGALPAVAAAAATATAAAAVSLSASATNASLIPAAMFMPQDDAAAAPGRQQLKKLKKKMAKQLEVQHQAELQLPKYEVPD